MSTGWTLEKLPPIARLFARDFGDKFNVFYEVSGDCDSFFKGKEWDFYALHTEYGKLVITCDKGVQPSISKIVEDLQNLSKIPPHTTPSFEKNILRYKGYFLTTSTLKLLNCTTIEDIAFLAGLRDTPSGDPPFQRYTSVNENVTLNTVFGPVQVGFKGASLCAILGETIIAWIYGLYTMVEQTEESVTYKTYSGGSITGSFITMEALRTQIGDTKFHVFDGIQKRIVHVLRLFRWHTSHMDVKTIAQYLKTKGYTEVVSYLEIQHALENSPATPATPVILETQNDLISKPKEQLLRLFPLAQIHTVSKDFKDVTSQDILDIVFFICLKQHLTGRDPNTIQYRGEAGVFELEGLSDFLQERMDTVKRYLNVLIKGGYKPKEEFALQLCQEHLEGFDVQNTPEGIVAFRYQGKETLALLQQAAYLVARKVMEGDYTNAVVRDNLGAFEGQVCFAQQSIPALKQALSKGLHEFCGIFERYYAPVASSEILKKVVEEWCSKNAMPSLQTMDLPENFTYILNPTDMTPFAKQIRQTTEYAALVSDVNEFAIGGFRVFVSQYGLIAYQGRFYTMIMGSLRNYEFHKHGNSSFYTDRSSEGILRAKMYVWAGMLRAYLNDPVAFAKSIGIDAPSSDQRVAGASASNNTLSTSVGGPVQFSAGAPPTKKPFRLKLREGAFKFGARVKSDSIEGLKRAGARTAVNTLHKPIVQSLRASENPQIKGLADFLDTTEGKALFQTLLGHLLPLLPGEHPRLDAFATEVRIEGISVLIGGPLNAFGDILVTYLADLMTLVGDKKASKELKKIGVAGLLTQMKDLAPAEGMRDLQPVMKEGNNV